MLKPLQKTTEFCGACHKGHLPTELTDYKWLRGQNHYDSFWLSGVSGHNVESFYYPPKAEENCNACHMPLREVEAAVPAQAALHRLDRVGHLPQVEAAELVKTLIVRTIRSAG